MTVLIIRSLYYGILKRSKSDILVILLIFRRHARNNKFKLLTIRCQNTSIINQGPIDVLLKKSWYRSTATNTDKRLEKQQDIVHLDYQALLISVFQVKIKGVTSRGQARYHISNYRSTKTEPPKYHLDRRKSNQSLPCANKTMHS